MKRTRSNLFLLASGIVAGIFIPAAHAANGTWSTDVAGNWSDTTKWTGAIVADGIGSIADFSTLNIAAGRTVTIDTTSRTVGTIKFGDTGATGDSAWTLAAAGGATLTLATGSAVQPLIDMGSTGIVGSFAQHTVSAPLAGTAGFNLTGSNQIVFNTGTLTNVSGTATISAGRLALQATDLGGLTAVDVKAGGHLGLWNTGGSYTQNISLAGTGNGETGFEAALRVANAGATVTLGGTITLTGNATIGGRDGGTGGTIFNGVIGGAAGNLLTFGTSGLNNGTYTLNGANTYFGGTTIAFGTVLAGNNLALGSGAVTVNGGAILNANGSTLANATTLIGGTLTNSSATAGAIGSVTLSAGRSSTVSTTGTGVLTLGTITRQTAAFVNFTNTTANTIATTNGSANAVLTDATTGAPYATFGGTDWAAKDATNTYVVGLSTLGGYTAVATAGSVTLSGHANLTDATTVNPIYTLAGDSAPSTIRAITAPAATSTATTLALNGATLTTAGILASQPLTISGTGSIKPAVAGGELLFNVTGNTTNIKSTIGDNTSASSLTKTGAGTLGLVGTQSYTGVTNVMQGTLQLGSITGDSNAAATLATSGFNVSAGATLVLGNGTLSATQNITGAGSFTKGGGFFTNGAINGTNNNYTGATNVNVNTLTVGTGAVINGTSSITVSNINASALANNSSITTPGALNVNGGSDTAAGTFINGNAGGTTPGILNGASLTLGAANTQTAGTAHGGAFTNNLNSTVSLTGGLTVNGEGSATTIASSAVGSLFTHSGGTVTIGGSLTLNNSATTNTFSNRGGTYTQTAGTTTTAGALSLVATGTDIASGAAGNDAAFNLSGGTATFGSASLNGTTTVSGTGTLNVSGGFNMGDAAADRSGIFNQTGGTTNITSAAGGAVRIGHWGSESSVINLGGGTFNVLNTAMNVGWDGTGTLNLSGTGTANFRQLSLGSNGGAGTGNGSVNLTGGRLNIGSGGITTPNALGTKAINLGAGTVGAFGNWSSSLAMSLTDAATSTTFDTLDSVDLTTGRTITLSGVISGAGALVKTGVGTLTLSGANTYAGNTAVSTGTLNLSATGRLKFLLGAASGTSNTLSGAGTATLDGGFAIDTTAADGLASGNWTLDTMGATSTYNSGFKVYQADGTTAWTDAGGDKWTQPAAGGKTWTFDETTGTLTLAQQPGTGFDSWATSKGLTGSAAAFDADPDNDGLKNGLEFVLGGEPNPANPGSNSAALLPTVSQTAGNLTFTFKRKDVSEAGTTLKFQWSTDLSFPSPANDVPIGAVDSTTGTIGVDVTEDAPDADTDTIVITVPAAKAAGGKLFGRLNALKAP